MDVDEPNRESERIVVPIVPNQEVPAGNPIVAVTALLEDVRIEVFNEIITRMRTTLVESGYIGDFTPEDRAEFEATVRTTLNTWGGFDRQYGQVLRESVQRGMRAVEVEGIVATLREDVRRITTERNTDRDDRKRDGVSRGASSSSDVRYSKRTDD